MPPRSVLSSPIRRTLPGFAVIALLISAPAMAQVNGANVRALNLAREWAVRTNGGLSVYRPADCMFQTNTGGGSCLVRVTDQGYDFRFLGGPPGWQPEGRPATVETEIQISPDGRTVTNVAYNGTPR
jgi:hypothetical protein